MEPRTRAYTRKMRAKHIKRKKAIVSNWSWFANGYYPYDGMYSKNKIHCSCPMCATKTKKDGYSHSDLKKLAAAAYQEIE
jgi:hypothetical protein